MLPLQAGTCKNNNHKMSKKGSRSDQGQQAPDLSALDFGPAWAKPGKGKASHSGAGKAAAGKSGKHPAKRGREDGRAGRHEKNFTGKARDHRESKRGRGGADGGDGYKGRGRRDGGKDKHQRKPMTPVPEGITARIMPIEAGMDAMSKQISATARTHSVFDLAWLVLGGLDRFHVIFESEEQPLYRSKSDHSVWLNQRECMSHFWASGLAKKYYEEEITEVEPPTGNFQSVARCGLSGKLIGPPNHHDYQQAMLDLHRERFSNMPLDRYKAKIVMEHGEEVVQEWLDGMRKRKRWRPRPAPLGSVEDTPVASQESKEEESQQNEAVHADAAADTAAEPEEAGVQVTDPGQPEEAAAEQVEQSGESEASEISDKSEQEGAEEQEGELLAADETEAQTDEVQTVVDATVPIFDNHREVEQHFLHHSFEEEFAQGNMVSVLANVPHKMINPGLMTLLKNTIAEEKRYPGKLASILCRQMSGRHLAVFKWKKRLHCGPARPRHVPDDMVMADRPGQLFHWVLDHPGGNIDEMWKDLLPKDIDEDTRHAWYHDLHWLINEGLVLLFSDGTLHAAKELVNQPAKKTAAKKAGKSGGKAVAVNDTEESASAPIAEQSASQPDNEITEDPEQDGSASSEDQA